jgi:hypothetical protein
LRTKIEAAPSARLFGTPRLFRKNPFSHDIDHGLEPGVTNPFAVDGGHRRVNVSHDAVDSNLVFALSGDRLETVPQRIKVSA